VITPVDIRPVPLADLTPFPGNAKKGDIPRIRESLRRLGQYRSLTVRQCDDGTLVILAGNNTYAAMGEEGWDEARCEIITCDDDEARRINVGDNKLGELGTTDKSALAAIMAMFEGDFEATGFVAPEVDDLLRTSGFLGAQATAFLNDFTAAEPVGATHQPAGPPVPSGTTPAAPGPAQPAVSPSTGDGQPTVSLPDQPPVPPDPAYVPMSWMVLPDDRDIIRQAIVACQSHTGAETSADALVAIAQFYLDDQAAKLCDDERTSP
jgi:hypothetical protein